MQEEQVQAFAEESRSEGKIGIGLYWTYLRAGANTLMLLLLVALNLFGQVRRVPERERVRAGVRGNTVLILIFFYFRFLRRSHTSCKTGGWLTGEKVH